MISQLACTVTVAVINLVNVRPADSNGDLKHFGFKLAAINFRMAVAVDCRVLSSTMIQRLNGRSAQLPSEGDKGFEISAQKSARVPADSKVFTELLRSTNCTLQL